MLIAKDTITHCLNNNILQFYACDHLRIFEKSQDCEVYSINLRTRAESVVNGLNVWFFFFDKDKELCGFRLF